MTASYRASLNEFRVGVVGGGVVLSRTAVVQGVRQRRGGVVERVCPELSVALPNGHGAFSGRTVWQWASG